MGAQGVGHGRLDGVRVGEAHHHAAPVGCAKVLQGADHPGLHPGKALSVGEPEGRRIVLDGLPLRQARKAGERGAGPVTEVALQKSGFFRHRHVCPCRRRFRGFLCTLQGRGVDGLDGQAGKAFGNSVRLGTAALGKVQSRGPAGQDSTRGGCFAVPHQEDQRTLSSHQQPA